MVFCHSFVKYLLFHSKFHKEIKNTTHTKMKFTFKINHYKKYLSVHLPYSAPRNRVQVVLTSSDNGRVKRVWTVIGVSEQFLEFILPLGQLNTTIFTLV